jgi:hypothetical protein
LNQLITDKIISAGLKRSISHAIHILLVALFGEKLAADVIGAFSG